jgi:putative SOS response-associated peptidase YedK
MCHDLSLFVGYQKHLKTDFPALDIIADDYLLETDRHFIAQVHAPQPVIYQSDNRLHVAASEWGIIAPYMNTEASVKQYRNSMVNARSEKLFEKASYWSRIRNQRCLVPVSGIYEHRKIEGWKKKLPYFISLKNEPLFYLPGLYEYTPAHQTGEAIGTFTILTRAANSLMKQIHNDGANQHRMPLFLPLETAKGWINTSSSDDEIQDIINYEMPATGLNAWPVFSIRGKQIREDGKEIHEHYDWGEEVVAINI